jgi:uncharacterized protein YbjT (DUF2867 family)
MPSKRVLVIGATGLVGSHIVPALQQRGHKVHAVVRRETLSSQDPAKLGRVADLARRGVVIHEGSLEDAESLTRACRAVEVVVSAVDPMSVATQAGLLEAIKAAGTIERFLPSEYGGDPHLSEPGRIMMFDIKREFQKAIESSGVPYTYVYSNCLASLWAVALGQVGDRPPTEAVTVLGDGNVGAAITTLEDNARFIAASIDDPRTLAASISILGDTTTQNDLIDHWEAVTGTKLERVHVTREQVDALIEDAAKSEGRILEVIMTQLGRAVWLDGVAGKLGEGVLDATALYPEIRRESPRAFLDRLRKPTPLDAMSGAVRGYLEGVRSGDPAAVAAPFSAAYWSEQPFHPTRSFTGAERVAEVYGKLFADARSVDLRVPRFNVEPVDTDGVARHWLEIELDLHRKNGTVEYLSGVLVFDATDAEIRSGRVYIEPVTAS